ncbi:zonadhesin-like [Argonauta hians]
MKTALLFCSWFCYVVFGHSFNAKTWFIEVKNCYLPHRNYLDIQKDVSLETCAFQCLLTEGCQSFEYAKEKRFCYLSVHDARTFKARYSFDRDYYQMMTAEDEYVKMLGISIRGHDLKRFYNIPVEECLQKCQSMPECMMAEYKKEHNKCDLSNVTYSSHALSVNAFGWDFYQKNRVYCDLKCGPQESCKVVNSQKKCVCLPGSIKNPKGNGCHEKQLPKGKTCRCSASGDPHYRTFDGQVIHFMGTCKYTLARSLTSHDTQYFNVEVKNENRGNKKVSYTRMVDVQLKHVHIRILPGRKIRINNLDVEAPVISTHLGFSVKISNGWVHVESTFGLRVSFDGRHRVVVVVPRETFGGQMTGICGDCNGKRDDMRTRNGTMVDHEKKKFSLIGESYRVKDDSDKPQLRCIETEPAVLCKEHGMTNCEIIRNPKGMFGKCIEELGSADVGEFYESCLFDYCYYANSTDVKKIVCAALESFAAECEASGIVYDWRKITNCPLECQANMEYKYKASSCQPTCVESPAKCSSPDVEGCVCKTGFVLSGEDCIVPRDCGCTYDGNYIKLGGSMTLPGCNKIVVCEKDGTARGRRKFITVEGCVENSQCLTRDGRWQCICDKGFAYNDNNTACEKVPVCGIEPVDIQFVVDISSSIRAEGLYQTKKFLTEFVNASMISPSQTQMGIIEFNNRYKSMFYLEDAKTKQEIKEAIQTLGPVHSGTRLGAALRHTAHSALRRHANRHHVRKVVIVFTDGQIWDVRDVRRWSKELRLVNKARIVVIGIGRVDVGLLREMTQGGGKVLYASRFGTIQQVIDDLYRVVCK